MDWQLDLGLSELHAPEIMVGGSMMERFEAFHALNPHVMRALIRLARWTQNDGWRVCSIKLLFEQLRWQWAVQTQGDVYKLNNNFHAYYARLIMHRHPDLAGFFRIRRQADGYDPALTPEG